MSIIEVIRRVANYDHDTDHRSIYKLEAQQLLNEITVFEHVALCKGAEEGRQDVEKLRQQAYAYGVRDTEYVYRGKLATQAQQHEELLREAKDKAFSAGAETWRQLAPGTKCHVGGCDNKVGECRFVGNLCAPCYDYLKNTRVKDIVQDLHRGNAPVAETSLRKLQTTLPWTIKYSQDFRTNPQPHKDFAHALVHVSKALGKLFAFVDDMDHDRAKALLPGTHEEYSKYVADLVVCALRAANTFPGGKLDLQGAVEERIATKNAPPADEKTSEHIQDAVAYAVEGVLSGQQSVKQACNEAQLKAHGKLQTLIDKCTKIHHEDDAWRYTGMGVPKLSKFVALDADGHYLGLFKAIDEEGVRKQVSGAAVVRLAEPWK